MGGVLCSTLVSVKNVISRLKMRKLLGVHYRQDIISGAEVNNVINNNELLGVSTSFVILYYFSLYHYFFSIHQKWKLTKILGGGLQPSPLPPRFLQTWVNQSYQKSEIWDTNVEPRTLKWDPKVGP